MRIITYGPLLLVVLLVGVLLTNSPAGADIVAPGWVDYTGAEYANTWSNSQVTRSLPFDFSFYGGAWVTNEVILQSNGYLGFGPYLNNLDDPPAWPYATWQEQRSRIAAPLWHDFNPSASSNSRIYYQTVGSGNERRFVVTWDAYADAAETERNIFQAQLHEATGQIQYSYHTISGVDGARVGVNYGDGVEYTGFWYDGAQNYDGGGLHNANQQGPTGSLEGWSIYYDFNPATGSYEATSQYIPEPGTMALLLVGIGAGAALKRRRTAA